MNNLPGEGLSFELQVNRFRHHSNLCWVGFPDGARVALPTKVFGDATLPLTIVLLSDAGGEFEFGTDEDGERTLSHRGKIIATFCPEHSKAIPDGRYTVRHA